MADPAQISQTDQRRFRHYPARGNARVISDRDFARRGVRGKLHDVSHSGLSVVLPAPLEIGQGVSIELENSLQRIRTVVRGRVVYVQQIQDGLYRIGVGLEGWLTPSQVQALKAPGV